MKHRFLFLLILVSVSVGLTACEPEDVQFVQAMLDEWANSKNVNPTNKDGSLNFGGLINAGTSALDLPGGDDEVKAAIDAKGVVDSIQAADKAAADAQAALKNGDAKKAVNLLDPAINDRPSDWWLLDQRGVANIEAGYADAGTKDLQAAIGNGKRAQIADHQRQLLFDSIARQSAHGGLARCSTFIAMGNAYSDLLNSGTGDANFYRSQMNANTQATSQPGVTCK